MTRARGAVYSQILLFHARSKSPQLAAQLAQTWADLFKKRVDELALRGIEDTYKLVASKLEKGKIAKISQASDIQIAGNAVKPERPTGTRRLFKVEAAVQSGGYATEEDQIHSAKSI